MPYKDKIIANISSWMLYCAVAIFRGEDGFGSLTFDVWFSCCEQTWVPGVSQKTGASAQEIKKVLGEFIAQNRDKSSDAILQELTEQRNEKPGLILKPGESITVTLS